MHQRQKNEEHDTRRGIPECDTKIRKTYLSETTFWDLYIYVTHKNTHAISMMQFHTQLIIKCNPETSFDFGILFGLQNFDRILIKSKRLPCPAPGTADPSTKAKNRTK